MLALVEHLPEVAFDAGDILIREGDAGRHLGSHVREASGVQG